jgi:polar amino acid transport system substrate-binding protein
MIAAGKPLRQVGDPVFTEYLAPAVDQKASKDPRSLQQKITELIQAMHTDGSITRLAQQYYAQDVTSPAAQFELGSLGQ